MQGIMFDHVITYENKKLILHDFSIELHNYWASIFRIHSKILCIILTIKIPNVNQRFHYAFSVAVLISFQQCLSEL